MKRLWDLIDWNALQAFIAVIALPSMIIFGGITILIFNP
jgi:hypothetical protein